MDGPGTQLRSSAVMSARARWRGLLGKTLAGYTVRKGMCVRVSVCICVFVCARSESCMVAARSVEIDLKVHSVCKCVC